MGERLLYYQVNALINWMVLAVIVIYLLQIVYLTISISTSINKCYKYRRVDGYETEEDMM